MLQTIYFIPNEIAGIPLFGFGLLLAFCAIACVVTVAWLAWRQGFNADTLGYIPLFAVLGAIVWFILPHVREPEGLPIRGYGTMLLVAVLASIGLTVWRGRKLGLDPDMIIMLCFWMILPGIIGARIFFIVQYREDFDTIASLLNFTKGGLVVYGSVIGGTAGLLVFVVRQKLPLLATCDLMAPSFMLGLALGRLGCFLNGCCFGGVCDLPWAVEFPVGSPAHIHQIEHGQTYLHGLQLGGLPPNSPVITAVEPGSAAEQQGLRKGSHIAAINGVPVHTFLEAEHVMFRQKTPGSEISIKTAQGETFRWAVDSHVHQPIHPTQIYSSISALIVCLLLLAYAPFRTRDGQVFALFLTVYPITRFLLEMIRNDESAIFGTGLTISQNVSLALVACAGILWIVLSMRPRDTAFPTYHPTTEKG
jgi:phosphatidylglycerol---prolipoprotein diacylglyceryl transferase